MRDDLRDIDDVSDAKKVMDQLQRAINDQQRIIERIQAPNMKAMQKLDEARNKLQETNEEFENARKKARLAKQKFERVKKDRHTKFMDCFDHVSNIIDYIYKVRCIRKTQLLKIGLGAEKMQDML